MSDTPHLVLVVDDNDASRFARVETLRRAGYRVVDAGSGRDGLDLAERHRPDAVLLDVNLPDIHGLEVCRRLKALTDPPVPVLQISATATTDDARARGLANGADAYLTEPVSTDVLLATLRALLRAHRAERRLAEALGAERQAREEAERVSRFKDDFLATLSHELRTPVSAAVSWLWHLRHNPGDAVARDRAIEGLERSTQLQLRLINDLLDVARIGRGKLALEVAPVDLAPLVDEGVASVRASVVRKALELRVRTAPLIVQGDAARLQQVIANLLSNAVRFTPRGKAIEVVAEAVDGRAVVRVTDEGIGIEPDLLPRIFDQFRQAEAGTARRHGGLGLGLTIVKELVARHRGTVSAESDGLDRGATFTVSLPLVSTAARASEADPDGAPESLADRNILVVDDDEDSRSWLQVILTGAGARVRAAASVEAALALVNAERPDLVVTDIAMPGRDGFELIARLRDGHFVNPVVAVTACCAAGEERRVHEAGFDAYFGKPVDPSRLLARIAALLAVPSPGTDQPR